MKEDPMLDQLTIELTALGYLVERSSESIRVSRPDRLAVYQVFGDDDIAERCCYVNGIMVDLDVLNVIREGVKWPAEADRAAKARSG